MTIDHRALPFCELHVHVEGTLEPPTIFSLADANGLRLPYDRAELEARYEFTSLQSFLDLYYENMQVLLAERDFFELTTRYLDRARLAGVSHVEMFVDPQAHMSRGVSAETVLTGVHRAIAQAQGPSFSVSIIVCILRDQSVDSARRMLDEVLQTDIPILGLGLDSAEVGHPPSKFKDVFAVARDAGLRVVAHAGEEGPPEYVWEALDVLGAERIDHGIRCLEDPALVTRLASDHIPLTVCPLSNVRLAVVHRLEDLPLRTLIDRGLLVTLNSDDPAYFGGYLDDNVEACIRTFGLTPDEVVMLADNSITASFVDDQRRAQLRGQLPSTPTR
jgi:adenosine deaminase